MRLLIELKDRYREQNIYAVNLANDNGFSVDILNYGAVITGIYLPDKNGDIKNMVLAYKDHTAYYEDPYYLGGVVGRYANRIAGGILNIGEQVYQLAINETANHNHLHGGKHGLNKRTWTISKSFQTADKAGIELSYTSPHLEEGYPGNLIINICYTITNNNELIIDYTAHTDRTTTVNLTNHSYFNLSGGAQDISAHLLSINAPEYTPTDDRYLPTGEILTVNNSIYDLQQPKQVSLFMEQIPTLNYCLPKHNGLKQAALLTQPDSGLSLNIQTTTPSLQLYCGNFLDTPFAPFAGICLEPHYSPDSPNHSGFPSTLLYPGKQYHETTVYSFSNTQ
jgi:aldose 1-epimerase